MDRINITLDAALFAELRRLAKEADAGIAGVARRLLQEAIDHRRRVALDKLIRAAYAAGANDPEDRETLLALQGGQDELLEDEE